MTGRTIGHFEILEKLGEGGMGVVWKARDTRLDRLVAVKVLPADKVANPERKRRFVQEAKAASALNHPNIITIYEISSEDGVDSIVMEFVRGKTLDQLIPRKGQRTAETLKYTIQIADALAKAHAAGIVHRDLKPGNIMVSDDGLVKVLDFGLAKLTEPAEVGEDGETRTIYTETDEGAILGTACYMSPEQAEAKKVDARSDIFAFGSVLYEMVTGRRAFRGDSQMSILAAILHEEPPPVSKWAAGVPRDLEKIIARCLRKDPARRFQHMADLRVALEELKEESDSQSLMTPSESVKKGRISRWWIAAGAALLVPVAGAVWWLRPSLQERAFEAKPLTTYAGSETDPSFSPDGSQIAFAWQKEETRAFVPWLDVSTASDIYVKVIGGGGPPLRLTSDGGTHYATAWSPDGQSISFSARHPEGRNGVYVIPALGGPERLVAEGVTTSSLDWSPDSRWLAADGAVLISVESGERRRLAEQNPDLQGADQIHFSPDGARITYLRGPGGPSNYAMQPYVVDLTPDMRVASKPRRVAFSDLGFYFPAWTADGREIILMLGEPWSNGSLARVSADGKGKVRKIPGLGYTAGPIAIARKGGRMAFSRGGVDADIWRFDLKDKEPPQRWASSTLHESGAAYSPDGKRIVFSSNRSGAREIWVCDADGSNAQQLTHFGGPTPGTARWSPDGRWIIFDARPRGTSDIFVIDAEGGDLRRVTESGVEPTWSPDGKWIYFGSDRSGRDEIWRIPFAGGAAVKVTNNGGGNAYAAPEGEWVYFQASAPQHGLRKVRQDGSGDSLAVDAQVPWLEYTVTRSGVWFVSAGKNDTVEAQRFADGERSVVLQLPFFPLNGFSLSPDERYLLLTKPDEKGTDLMLVENFR